MPTDFEFGGVYLPPIRENQPGNRLLANVNPTYTWVKLAQRIPVRLRLQRNADAVPLRAGTTATVTILE